tara:strand:- start:5129 stop:5941 length:813 start_codon:yes stop_codon:yes gene_type:complete
MSLKYFKSLSTIKYDIKGDNVLTEATNILKRVKVRDSLSEFVSTFYKRSSKGQRPEMMSHEEYNDVYTHWILLYLNNIEDPYYEWHMDEQSLQSYIDKKYPYRVCRLEKTHYSQDDKAQFWFFYPGERITDINSSASPKPYATCVSYDSDLIQVTYKDMVGSDQSDKGFDDTNPQRAIIQGGDTRPAGEGAKGIVEAGGDTIGRNAVHHYEDSDKNIISRATYELDTSNNTKVTNAEYEISLNDVRREISVLEPSLVEQFEKEFLEKING